MDKDYWESHWRAREHGAGHDVPANPYLATETSNLQPGTALDAGCGEGAEATWLASRGWSVTAADISAEALARASTRVAQAGVAEQVRFVEADLSAWEPELPFDLVTTHYAHPATSQLTFYQRISRWVAPGGTLLIVGHLRTSATPQSGDRHGHDDGHPPEEASVSADSVTATLDSTVWDIVTATEQVRTLDPDGVATELHDVVVRATRHV